eukprot:scaffold173375_cov25-Prasinocladus_malaysianus.AAC.1
MGACSPVLSALPAESAGMSPPRVDSMVTACLTALILLSFMATAEPSPSFLGNSVSTKLDTFNLPFGKAFVRRMS